ncbi:MAG TPA: glycosyltransferase family 2 protein [Bacteroidota bacterium]|nr:glycosyltransferase family 2 protein [Bacteroidota bacterium]
MGETLIHRPKVCVILLNWNGAEFTIPCVESLLAQSYDRVEIVVVDNGSTDDSRSLLDKKFGKSICLLPLEENKGFTGGNNIGIRHALQNGADYVLVLNNDTIADRKFVEELVVLAESDKRIGVVTGKIFYYDEKELLWFAGGDVQRGILGFKHRGLLEKDNGKYDAVEESQFVTGCCMCVRREVFRTVGLFDDRYFIYSEDADFCLRVLQQGYSLMYTPRALLYHKESASMRKNTLHSGGGTVSSRQYYLSTRNRIFTIRKHSPPAEKVMSLAAVFLETLLRSAFFVAKKRWEKLSWIWRGLYEGTTTDLRSENNAGKEAAFAQDGKGTR